MSNEKKRRPSTYPGYELPANCDYPLIKKDDTQTIPLYKVLKDKILPGEWKVEEFDNDTYLINGEDEKGDHYHIATASFKAHADLISMAPNLILLAEALEGIIRAVEFDGDALPDITQSAAIKAKEALQRIS